MNNLIVIAGADFSGIEVEKIFMQEKVFLNKDQYSDKLLKYFSANSETGILSYGNGSQGTYLLLYEIHKGNYVVVDNQTSRYGIALIKDNNVVSPHFMKNSGFINKNSGYSGEIRFLAEEDGYVAIYAKVNNSDIFPSSVYLTNKKPSNRVLTDNNIVYKPSSIIQEDGTFISVTGAISYFYNVFAGETVNITANSSYGTKYAFLDFDKYLLFAKNNFSQDHLIELNAGDTDSVVVQKQCLLCVMANDGINNTFPANLSVSVE